MMKRIFMMVLANVLMIMTSPAQTNRIQNPILPGSIPTRQYAEAARSQRHRPLSIITITRISMKRNYPKDSVTARKSLNDKQLKNREL